MSYVSQDAKMWLISAVLGAFCCFCGPFLDVECDGEEGKVSEINVIGAALQRHAEQHSLALGDAERLPDVELTDLRNTVYKMVGKELATSGGRTYCRYELSDGRKEKK